MFHLKPAETALCELWVLKGVGWCDGRTRERKRAMGQSLAQWSRAEPGTAVGGAV
jgi:hypothetical protein